MSKPSTSRCRSVSSNRRRANPGAMHAHCPHFRLAADDADECEAQSVPGWRLRSSPANFVHHERAAQLSNEHACAPPARHAAPACIIVRAAAANRRDRSRECSRCSIDRRSVRLLRRLPAGRSKDLGKLIIAPPWPQNRLGVVSGKMSVSAVKRQAGRQPLDKFLSDATTCRNAKSDCHRNGWLVHLRISLRRLTTNSTRVDSEAEHLILGDILS